MANMYLDAATKGTWFIIDNEIFNLNTGVYFDYFGVSLCGYRLHVKKHTAKKYEVYITKGKYKSEILNLYKDEATRIILVEFIDSPKYVGSKFTEGLTNLNDCFDGWCDSKFYNYFRLHPIKSGLSTEDLLWQCLKIYPKLTIVINQSKGKYGFLGVALQGKRARRNGYKPYLKSALLYALYNECKDNNVGTLSFG